MTEYRITSGWKSIDERTLIIQTLIIEAHMFKMWYGREFLFDRAGHDKEHRFWVYILYVYMVFFCCHHNS